MFKSQEYAKNLENSRIIETIPKNKCYINKSTNKVVVKSITFDNELIKQNWELVDIKDVKNILSSRKSKTVKSKPTGNKVDILDNTLKSD